MRIKATKDCRWSIDYVAVPFKTNEEYEVSDLLGQDMINKGYAEKPESKKKTKETMVEENKSVESVEENKKEEAIEPTEKKKKHKKSKYKG